MFGKHFELNEQTMAIVEEIGQHMPGGFFIYQASEPTKVLYVNQAVLDIFGCDDLEEFTLLTGGTFRGMLLPEDYDLICASISQQIQSSEDKMDYVEYRIIRKDGSVRWVDDYGHYTETEAYGGIFYVFISDITQKRERMESDLAVRQAVIEALSEAYNTVWLITDVKKGTFSLYRGDIDGKTFHSAPIKDALGQLQYSRAKEQYIRTNVAPVDRKRLSRELELGNIARRLEKRPQFSMNYLRLMDDGSQRYFRIELARLQMPGGKMGVVCGFKDVDADIREGLAVQKALREAKRAEVQQQEERQLFREQLQEQQRRREQQSKLITALASDYWSVYYVELDRDRGICYQPHPDVDSGFRVGDEFPYLESFTQYANTYITDPFRDEFLHFIQPDSIRDGLKRERVISFRYTVRRRGEESYEMVRFAGVRHPEDRDDHIVHAVSACFANVDTETRKTLEQSHALADALATAEQANIAKTAFLSSMSHEIRTPMNAIIGLNNIALSDPQLPLKSREQLEKLGDSARHLLGIINDILDMSRIESGRMLIRNEEFPFSKILEQVNAMISSQCSSKGLHYECRVKGKIDDYYFGDDIKLRQVLVNILSNAVKFTPEGGSVTFVVEETARFDRKVTLRFVISDTGIGMSEAYLPHLFDPFSQEDSSSTGKYGSTGLGMAIAKNIVAQMNGSIHVDSKKGVGSAFTVTVTLGESDRREASDPDAVPHPHLMSALVIDDDPIACEHAQIVLGQAGISCDIALTGAEGIEMANVRHARREAYDLILVDWRMPEMDGVETAKRIRDAAGDESAIIILTSYNWDDIADEAKAAGVDSFTAKPLFASAVLDEFRTALRRRNTTGKRAADLRGRRVLLAEDVPVNAEITTMLLGMREVEVDHAANGRIAVEKFSASSPGYYDAILMDIRMPEMDGLEATRMIRAMDRADARSIPIIALTANAFDEDVQRSMQAGLNAHLSKPVQPDVLFSALESLIPG